MRSMVEGAAAAANPGVTFRKRSGFGDATARPTAYGGSPPPRSAQGRIP